MKKNDSVQRLFETQVQVRRCKILWPRMRMTLSMKTSATSRMAFVRLRNKHGELKYEFLSDDLMVIEDAKKFQFTMYAMINGKKKSLVVRTSSEESHSHWLFMLMKVTEKTFGDTHDEGDMLAARVAQAHKEEEERKQWLEEEALMKKQEELARKKEAERKREARELPILPLASSLDSIDSIDLVYMNRPGVEVDRTILRYLRTSEIDRILDEPFGTGLEEYEQAEDAKEPKVEEPSIQAAKEVEEEEEEEPIRWSQTSFWSTSTDASTTTKNQMMKNTNGSAMDACNRFSTMSSLRESSVVVRDPKDFIGETEWRWSWVGGSYRPSASLSQRDSFESRLSLELKQAEEQPQVKKEKTKQEGEEDAQWHAQWEASMRQSDLTISTLRESVCDEQELARRREMYHRYCEAVAFRQQAEKDKKDKIKMAKKAAATTVNAFNGARKMMAQKATAAMKTTIKTRTLSMEEESSNATIGGRMMAAGQTMRQRCAPTAEAAFRRCGSGVQEARRRCAAGAQVVQERCGNLRAPERVRHVMAAMRRLKP